MIAYHGRGFCIILDCRCSSVALITRGLDVSRVDAGSNKMRGVM